LRLHELWKAAEAYVMLGEMRKWNFVLDGIWRELYSDVLKLPNAKELLEQNEQQKKLIQVALPDPKRLPQDPKKRWEGSLYGLLNKRHETLKKIQSDCGKGSAYESTTEGDFD